MNSSTTTSGTNSVAPMNKQTELAKARIFILRTILITMAACGVGLAILWDQLAQSTRSINIYNFRLHEWHSFPGDAWGPFIIIPITAMVFLPGIVATLVSMIVIKNARATRLMGWIMMAIIILASGYYFYVTAMNY